MKTFKTNCGCKIHVIKWSAKANSITVKSCPLHKHAKELLEAARAVEPLVVGALAFVDCKKQLSALQSAIAKTAGEVNFCAAGCGYPVAYPGSVCGECACEEDGL